VGPCGVAVLNRKSAISLKRGKTGPRLLLMTDRNLHMHFRLVPKSTTLNGHYARCFKIHGFSEPVVKNGMNPHYQQRRCSSMTLVSGSIMFMGIFVEILWRGGVKRQWGCQKRQFSVISLAIPSVTLEMRPALLNRFILLNSETRSVVGFSAIRKCMTLNGYFTLNSVFAPVLSGF